VIVSHSLGSYLIFSALDMDQLTGQTATTEQTRNDLQEILMRTSLVVFFANQLRLLELVGLDGPSERNIATHLQDWGKVRCEYLKSLPSAPQECKPPRIIALNDPSDLLTWTVPALGDIHVEATASQISERLNVARSQDDLEAIERDRFTDSRFKP
jgi:hypothetical protein